MAGRMPAEGDDADDDDLADLDLGILSLDDLNDEAEEGESIGR